MDWNPVRQHRLAELQLAHHILRHHQYQGREGRFHNLQYYCRIQFQFQLGLIGHHHHHPSLRLIQQSHHNLQATRLALHLYLYLLRFVD